MKIPTSFSVAVTGLLWAGLTMAQNHCTPSTTIVYTSRYNTVSTSYSTTRTTWTTVVSRGTSSRVGTTVVGTTRFTTLAPSTITSASTSTIATTLGTSLSTTTYTTTPIATTFCGRTFGISVAPGSTSTRSTTTTIVTTKGPSTSTAWVSSTVLTSRFTTIITGTLITESSLSPSSTATSTSVTSRPVTTTLSTVWTTAVTQSYISSTVSFSPPTGVPGPGNCGVYVYTRTTVHTVYVSKTAIWSATWQSNFTLVVVTIYALVNNFVITLHPIVYLQNQVLVILGLYMAYVVNWVIIPVVQYIVGGC